MYLQVCIKIITYVRQFFVLGLNGFGTIYPYQLSVAVSLLADDVDVVISGDALYSDLG